MVVMKFGGTSVQDAACLRQVVSIVAAHRGARPLIVVSAVAGVTRQLLRLGEMAAAGHAADVTAAHDDVRGRHLDTLRDLELGDPTYGAVRRALDDLFAALRAIVDKIMRQAAYPPRMQDAVMSFGERLSSTLLVAASAEAGLPAHHVDAATFMITDDRFRSARPHPAEIRRRARTLIVPAVAAGKLVITEGFIGATDRGVATTMGFEASDLSASLLGAAIDAAEVQIWTDVPGMLSAGHAAVQAPLVVPRLTFDEAADLALFGAKVLHPGSIEPARDKGIPVRILQTSNPAGEGTWITDDLEVAVHREAGLGAAGRRETGAPPGVVKAIAVTEDPTDDSFAGVRATLDLEDGNGWDGRAIVCPVGQGIGTAEAVIEQMRCALNGIPATPLRGARLHAVPVAVPQERLAEAVQRLHDALITPPSRARRRPQPRTRGCAQPPGRI